MRILSWPVPAAFSTLVGWFLLASLPCFAGHALAAPGYYREPALHGDTVVFVAEGDLWRVAATGGRAQRLTTHAAPESQPVISPDGSQLAFVASYDGAPDVYVMPLAGGEPRRLTFDGSRAWLSGFSRSGEIVFASEYVIGPGMSRALRSVDPASGVVRDWPLADARELALDAHGDTAGSRASASPCPATTRSTTAAARWRRCGAGRSAARRKRSASRAISTPT